MGRELCFCIEERELYLEQVLVDYMEIPIFFLCKSDMQYYAALCVDMEELNYIVVKASMSEVYRLLHGEIPMRDVILNQREYWNVVSGEEVFMDMVAKHPTCELDRSFLPHEGACFEILTEEMEEFVQEFDNAYQENKKEPYGDGIPYINLSVDFTIEKCFDLGSCLLARHVTPEIALNETYTMRCEKKVILRTSDSFGEWSDDASTCMAA